MIKQTLFFLCLLIFQNAFCQVTFVVNKSPKNTTENLSIYISGDFEGWTGGQAKYKLAKEKGVYFITVPKQIGSINYKFTQGSWDTVETDDGGNNINNRTYAFSSLIDTVSINILSWKNAPTFKKSTATSNVFVLSESFEIPQLKRERRIWVYLPPDYENSTESYPVLYMHDAQNIFDNATSFSGEWQVDETLNKLYKEKGFKVIVIGIDNGGEERLNEYSPWENEKYGGGDGAAYTNFIVETLKPFVDKTYRTLPDKENTAIMGSSMGGLISYYAALKYADIFGKSGVFSPSFWFSDKSFEYAKIKGNLQKTRMYFLAGGNEGNNVAFNEISQTVKDMDSVVELLKTEGFTQENIFEKVVPEGQHNEKLWRENFEEAILWLFLDKIKE